VIIGIEGGSYDRGKSGLLMLHKEDLRSDK
jgi:hypothetical protein